MIMKKILIMMKNMRKIKAKSKLLIMMMKNMREMVIKANSK